MNFDSVARPYVFLERVAFGRILEHCRTSLLPALPPSRKALFIGEGDGRFLLRYLERFPGADVDIVERSAAMIRVAQRRIEGVKTTGRIRFVHRDIFVEESPGGTYDLVVTHFLLDVLTTNEVARLTEKMRHAAPDALWLLSEFQACSRPALARHATKWCITVMYTFFRVATGLKVRCIPDYASVFIRFGMRLRSKKVALGGFVVSELWELRCRQ